jgi:transcriptional regulator with XRE-family HTH domain
MSDKQLIEQGRRFRELRKHYKANQQQLADLLDSKQSYISAIETGNKGISRNLLFRLAELFPELNQNWLIKGDGSMIDYKGRRQLAISDVDKSREMSGILSQVSPKLIQVSDQNQVEEPSTTYASREDEIVYLRMYISYLEQFIYQKHPDYRPPEWRKKQG